jgi:hypothetical protein
MRISGMSRRAIYCALVLVSLALALPATSPATLQKSATLGAATGAVGHAHGTTVELEGTVKPAGQATTYYFEFGPTKGPPYASQTAHASLPAGPTPVKVALSAAPFLATYHYRLVVVGASGVPVHGKDHEYLPKATTLKVTLAKPPVTQHILVGAPVTITGALAGTGAAGHLVALQASPYPYTASFETVGSPQASSSAGRFSFRVASLSRNTEFRVVTLDPKPAESKPITELAAVRVTLRVRANAHRGLVRLYGTVSPAEVGAHVLVQLEKTAPPRNPPKTEKAEEKDELPRFGTTASAVVKRATKSFSRFSVVVTLKSTGHYRAFVTLAKGPYASGYSTTVLLHAGAASKKKAKAKG